MAHPSGPTRSDPPVPRPQQPGGCSVRAFGPSAANDGDARARRRGQAPAPSSRTRGAVARSRPAAPVRRSGVPPQRPPTTRRGRTRSRPRLKRSANHGQLWRKTPYVRTTARPTLHQTASDGRGWVRTGDPRQAAVAYGCDSAARAIRPVAPSRAPADRSVEVAFATSRPVRPPPLRTRTHALISEPPSAGTRS